MRTKAKNSSGIRLCRVLIFRRTIYVLARCGDKQSVKISAAEAQRRNLRCRYGNRFKQVAPFSAAMRKLPLPEKIISTGIGFIIVSFLLYYGLPKSGEVFEC
jgi:hypothetical protein